MSRSLVATMLAVAAFSCQGPQLAVYHPDLKGPRFTRVNLRSDDGVHLRSSNLLAEDQKIPVGSPAEVARFTESQVDIVINTLRHTMYPASGKFDTSEQGVKEFLEKYFVESEEEIDLVRLAPPEVVQKIRQGEVLKGMNKEQVYVTLGPPQWIDETNLPSVRLPKDRILESDRWVYTGSKLIDVVPKKAVYRFKEGKLEDMSR